MTYDDYGMYVAILDTGLSKIFFHSKFEAYEKPYSIIFLVNANEDLELCYY